MKIMREIFSFIARMFGRDKQSAPPVPEKSVKTQSESLTEWRGAAAVSVGAMHLKANPPIPCQDAALSRVENGIRPCAFVADGAGSASLSHFGAQETVLRLSHLSASLEDVHAKFLDMEESPSEEEVRMHAERFLVHASETVKCLAKAKNQPFKEFRCTLLAVIAGAERILWLKVGDGHIIRETDRKNLQIVGPIGKGEYANATQFINEFPEKTDFSFGVLPAANIFGVALMTDGAAEKLVSHDGKKVAPRVAKFLDALRRQEFGNTQLEEFLSDAEIWKPPGYTGDDKGMALLSR